MKTTSFAGIYRVPEAARYLYVTSHLPGTYPKPTPRHLMLWMRQGIASAHLTNVSGRNVEIDFEDLVSMRIIYFLHGMGVSASKIRDAKTYLQRITNHSHPFATERLWTETVEIFAEIGPLLITASRSGQLPFSTLLGGTLLNVHDMTFSRGVADSWAPRPGILLRPRIQFGAPCIANTGIPARSVWRMFMGGDSVEFIAQSYGIKDNQIQQAIDWEDILAEVTFARPPQAPSLPSR